MGSEFKKLEFTNMDDCLSHILSRSLHFDDKLALQKFLFKHTNTYALTMAGMSMMSEFFESYKFKFDEVTTKEKINLSRYLKFPYYFNGHDTITIFNSKAAFMSRLYGDDVSRWLEVISSQLLIKI